MIRARDLRKSFVSKVGETVEAVKGIDVDVRRGEAFGFLGPNGAGKSSTMRMIAAVSPVSGGELRILGLDPAESTVRRSAPGSGSARRRTPSTTSSTSATTSTSTAATSASPRPRCSARADELLEFVQLTEKAKTKVEDLSGGMKRRLTIARSLINRPDLLLLDEPTTGLDPQARHVLWDRLFRLKQQGVTLVITTHYMDEAEQLCDRLVVMDKGLIVAEGSPLDLIRQHSTREVAELRFGSGRATTTPLAEKIADLGDRVEVAARPAAGLQRRRRGRARAGPRARARPDRHAGTPLHPGGRLPAAHRPDAGRLMTPLSTSATGPAAGRLTPLQGVARQVDYWCDRLPPHLEGLGRSRSFVVAAALRAGDGGAARRLHRRRPRRVLEGATSYLAFVVPGPDRGPRDADGGRRDDVPGDGHDQVAARASTTRCWPRRWGAATSSTRTLLFVLFRVGDDLRRLLRWCWRRSASSAVLVGAVRWPARDQLLVGMAFATWIYALQRPARVERGGVRVVFRLGLSRCSCSAARSSRSATSVTVGAWVARCTPLWHGVNLSRMLVPRPRRLVDGAGQRRGARRAHWCSAGSGRSAALDRSGS